MIKYRKVKVSKLEPKEIICNKCGVHLRFGAKNFPEFITIEHAYGYGSDKDGEKYISHICERCMDEFYASFRIEPDVEEVRLT
jgi:ribosomal-protein-alanine N-acetyltransferase